MVLSRCGCYSSYVIDTGHGVGHGAAVTAAVVGVGGPAARAETGAASATVDYHRASHICCRPPR
jgi:hypothetical protein